VIFNTNEPVTLMGSSNGRQFGPSVLAPFSTVTLLGSAGYVDGFVIARAFLTAGANAGALQLHGNGYSGPIICAPGNSSSTSASDTPVQRRLRGAQAH